MTYYRDLDVFSDLVDAARRSHPVHPVAEPGEVTHQKVMQTLSFTPGPDMPTDVKVEKTWKKDGLVGELITWSVGYGPRTESWLLKPENATGALPGVIALHDHGGFKYFGKEKIADGPDATPGYVQTFRGDSYGGVAFANELAKRGYVVLVNDVFTWGSRKMPTDKMAQWALDIADLRIAANGPSFGQPVEVSRHNHAAGIQEMIIEKVCTVLGTTMAGLISYEDRVAAGFLSSRDDVQPGGVGCVGLSGGGARSSLLQASCKNIRAAVVVGMMGTYEGLLDDNIKGHTWMMFPHGWAKHGDWTDFTACRAPSPLMVQYDLEDWHFPEKCMRDADKRIGARYASVNARKNYVGKFYPGPHKFDLEMQADAWDWFDRVMAKD